MRNSIGEAVASTTCLFVSTLDATSVDALAMLKGLELLERLGCTNIIIESDSLELINACKGEVDMFSPYTTTLVECFAKAQTIDGISFEFCPREANQVAHHLAKHAYDNQLEFSWEGDLPSFLLPYVLHDVTLLIKQ